jgi:RNA polymerase sigma-70 factor (ECF subfamily)
MISNQTDDELIAGLRRNDRQALADVYDTYSGVAYALATRVLGHGNDAEDVVQESFIALWRQAARLDAGRGIRAYLLTIVHNKAVDRVRRRGRRGEVNLDPELPLAGPESDDPQVIVGRAAEAQRVREALGELGEEQRRTVQLAYFAGLTTNQVAERMGVPVGTVKSRLRLALGHLRRRLGETP